ncbi:MAG: transglycosylase SLT domain-containing protein [Burkholderiales bacterium]|nr:transglycosylase SLT domain-containing protein [Burkholderiales bacterium]
MTAAEHQPDRCPTQAPLHRAWLVLLPWWLAACAQLEPHPSDMPAPTVPDSASSSAASPTPAGPAPAAAVTGAATEVAPARAESAPPGPPAAATSTAPAAVEVDAPPPVESSAPVEESLPRPALPRVRLDPDQDAERADLWQRLRDGVAIPDLDNDLVRKWERYYAGQPEYVQRMVERGARYLFHIVEEIDKRGMPLDLALLPFIESAFDPQALSRARAAGMWQFMPGTGRDFELRQNVFRDDRRGVLASTQAALDFLGKLHERFGDWQLALAAYNWGPGNVARAIERNRRARKPLDLSSLQRLPAETRNYVPKLQAMKNIVLRPRDFGIELAKLENHPYFLSVAIERDIDVELAARLAGLPLEEFRQLNPQHNRAVILSAGTPLVLLPYDNANQFVRALGEHDGPLASWTAWVTPRTLKTADAAKLVGVAEAQLAEVNHIPPRMLVRAGSTLIVPRGAKITDDVSESLADTATLTLAPEGMVGRVTKLRAGPKGDTVAAVARRHGLTAAQVAQWNQVAPNARFAPGAPIVLTLPVRRHVVVSGSGAGRALAKPAPRAARKPAAAAPGRVKVATR